MLSSTFKKGSEFGITLTNSKNVRVGQYKGQTFLSFHEETIHDGKTYNTFINFNADEWDQFLFYLPDLDIMLAKEVQYASGDNEWHFLEDAAKQYDGDGEIKRRLVPQLKNKDIVMLLYTYLMIEKIKKYLEEHCFGCTFDMLDQYAHMSLGDGCKQTWDDAVMFNFECVKPLVNLQQALDKLNNGTGWQIAMPDRFNEFEIYRMVCNFDDHILNRIINMPNDYEVYKLPDAYKRLFQYLNL